MKTYLSFGTENLCTQKFVSMFKNAYQGGPFVEIFSAQGKDPVAKWKLCGSLSAIRKEFDKEVKGFVYFIEGSSQITKMQLPKDNKQTLGLIQRFLVLQIYVPLGKDFATELQITDLENIKRRLYLSTVHKELLMTPLHAKIPLSFIKRKIWSNLCIDLVEFTSEIFRGAVFQSLDGIIISANCKLRKVFSMKLQPQDAVDDDGTHIIHTDVNELTDVIPRSCQISVDVPQVSQLLNMAILRKAELKSGRQPLISSHTDVPFGKGTSGLQNSKVQDVSHVAFGSKVLGPPPSSSRKPISCGSREITSSLSNRTNRSSHQSRGDKGAKTNQQQTKQSQLSPSSQDRDKENIHYTRKKSDLLSTDQLMQPHPPREPSAEKNSTRRRLRVRSAGKERTGLLKGNSSPVECRNEDRPFTKTSLSPYRRINSESILYSPRLQAETADQTADEWHFPEDSKDSFQLVAIQQCTDQIQASSSVLPGQLMDIDKENQNEQNESEPQLDLNDIFMYSSQPRSAPHGKSNNFSGEGFILPLDLTSHTELERRGARMEDDFYGSDSSEEDSLHVKFCGQTSSPQTGTSASSSPQSVILSKIPLQKLPRTSEDRATTASISDSSRELLPQKLEIPLAQERETETLQETQFTTPCLSPTGNGPGFSLENPSTSKRFTGTHVSQLMTSMNRKSLHEISEDSSRLTAEHTDSLHIKFCGQTSSPKTGTSATSSPQSVVLSKIPLQKLPRTSEDGASTASISDSSRELLPQKLEIPLLKERETEALQKTPFPTPCLSPTGNGPGFSLENPSTSKRFTGTHVSQLMTSMNRKSNREIPEDSSRLAAEHTDYDWRNYQPANMSISELQMLESLQRQQNEELEEDGNLHGLSASQINNCNVSISTSSDDTTTWNSCLPQPANQGHHYQKEMTPLLHSNPRDWLNAFSPPIIPLSGELTNEDDLSSSTKEILGKRLQGAAPDDSEDVLTLLYDPCLNCYYDPENGKYYELA